MSTNKFTTNNNPTLVAVSNADGETPVYLYADPTTHSLINTGLLPASYDYVGFSSADGNGNYQTVVYKIGGSAGTTVATLAMTFDASSNVTSITRT